MRQHSLLLIALSVMVGCSREGSSVPSVEGVKPTPAVFNAAHAPTVEFSVPDMMCPEGCGVKVKEILAEQPGAKDVLVDFDSKTAKVAIDEGKFDAQQAIAALVDHSFDHSTLKGDAVAKPQAEAPPAIQ